MSVEQCGSRVAGRDGMCVYSRFDVLVAGQGLGPVAVVSVPAWGAMGKRAGRRRGECCVRSRGAVRAVRAVRAAPLPLPTYRHHGRRQSRRQRRRRRVGRQSCRQSRAGRRSRRRRPRAGPRQGRAGGWCGRRWGRSPSAGRAAGARWPAAASAPPAREGAAGRTCLGWGRGKGR